MCILEIDMDNQTRILITNKQIADKVRQLATQIEEHYQDSANDLLLVGLLRGSVIFMADLCRSIALPHELDFMTASSYATGTTSSGDVKILKDLDSDICGKDVIIVEDIIDSGRTLSKIIEILKIRKPASLEVCTLINKPSRREIDIDVKFSGFEIDDKFIVGYGLDFEQRYRHLPFIAEIGL